MAIAIKQHSCINATCSYCMFPILLSCFGKCLALIIVLVHSGIVVSYCFMLLTILHVFFFWKYVFLFIDMFMMKM